MYLKKSDSDNNSSELTFVTFVVFVALLGGPLILFFESLVSKLLVLLNFLIK